MDWSFEDPKPMGRACRLGVFFSRCAGVVEVAGMKAYWLDFVGPAVDDGESCQI